jgi:hypothetical protein
MAWDEVATCHEVIACAADPWSYGHRVSSSSRWHDDLHGHEQPVHHDHHHCSVAGCHCLRGTAMVIACYSP